MDGYNKKDKGQVEINNLIGDAIDNAVARRHQTIDSQDALSTLTDEKAGSITGGSTVVEQIILIGGNLLGIIN